MPVDSRREDRRQGGVRDEFVDILLNHVANDNYPSITMMDLVEPLLTGPQRERYVQTLYEKVARESYPSIDLMRRISGLVSRM